MKKESPVNNYILEYLNLYVIVSCKRNGKQVFCKFLCKKRVH